MMGKNMVGVCGGHTVSTMGGKAGVSNEPSMF